MNTDIDLRKQAGLARRSFLYAGVFSAVALFAGCNGGNGSPGSDSGGTTAPTTNSGSVSGFGSVIVNGVVYDDSNVAITIDDGTAAVADDLRLGMVVDVEGPIDTAGLIGTAERITAHSYVQGPISAVDIGANQFTVLGVTVTTNEGTIFEGATGVADLAAGERVEIYGYGDNAGNLTATRIEREDPLTISDQVRLSGIVTDATATSFTINGVTVQYNAAAAAELDGNVVTNDMIVRVKGTLADTAALTINATDIQERSIVNNAEEGQELELEGVITAFRSTTNFDVNGLAVTVDANAEVEGTPAQGTVIEVEGTIADGVLVATEVEVKDARKLADVDVTGPVNNVNTTTQTFTMRGGRLTIRWDTTTEFDDETLPSGGASLANNQVLEVDGRIEGNVIVAESIEVTDDNGDEGSRVEAEGRIANLNVSDQTFTLRNGRLTVRWNSATEFDSDTLPGGAASLVNNLEIEAEGRLEGNVLVATEIKAEGED